MIRKEYYGKTTDGQDVNRFILTNKNGMEMTVLEYGAVVQSLLVPVPAASQEPNTASQNETYVVPFPSFRKGNVVLGHDTLEGYEKDTATNMGALVGRVANRIENAEFTLNGVRYPLSANDGPNHLHGVFPWRMFTGSICGDILVLERLSLDGEDGFPGNLKVRYELSLTDENELVIRIQAETDQDTLINLTNHNYYNLNGYGPENKGTILKHTLTLPETLVLDTDPTTHLPNGAILSVEGTCLDFTAPKIIDRDMKDPMLAITDEIYGYDHCYVLTPTYDKQVRHAATLTGNETGITADIYTTEPGLQFYTGNFVQDTKETVNGGAPVIQYAALALETQHFPNTPAHDNFPTVVLKAGESFESLTIVRFS